MIVIFRFRSSSRSLSPSRFYTQKVSELEKAIEVDPNLHTAYQHKVEILQERLQHDFMWGKDNEEVLAQYAVLDEACAMYAACAARVG